MPAKRLIDLLFLLLYRHRRKHMGVFLLSTLIVFVLLSFMLTAQSLHHTLFSALEQQPDFIVQKVRGGRSVDTPTAWMEEFARIHGVERVAPRLFGRYFYEPNETHFTLIGIDPFEAQSSKFLETLVAGLDLKCFIAEDGMLIGEGVKAVLDHHHFFDYYVFRAPDRSKIEVPIMGTLPREAAVLGNDAVLLSAERARTILGIAHDHATDIALFVPNPLERDTVRDKLIMAHFDTRIIAKSELEKLYERLYNYKGALFLSLFTAVLLSFMMILYARYQGLHGSERREIAILRAVGWSIKEVLSLKLLENALVAFGAFALGFVLSYMYVFFLQAPLLREVFMGFENLRVHLWLQPHLEGATLITVALLYFTPFMAAVLIPVWRAAITEPLEAMR
ncbi:MAG: FtsX-like permease family protein [Campylobacterales bacterium]|nr:FtsX-like permease family protein [Campylobacterales bacterium]